LATAGNGGDGGAGGGKGGLAGDPVAFGGGRAVAGADGNDG
jgi:hypothetical protein